MTTPEAGETVPPPELPTSPSAPEIEQPPPSWIDTTVAKATGALGGPWGRHAGNSGWWSPIRVLLALASITLVLGFAQKSPCASGNWTSNLQYTHACYSDVIPLWSTERFDVHAVPYRDQVNEYPVLTGAFMYVTALLTYAVHHLLPDNAESSLFGMLTSLLLAACALLAVAATAQAAGRRPYDAAIFAVSPLLVFHAFTNWDLLAIALASCALWAWSRRQPALAGVLIGLGTAAKLYPVLLLLPIVVLAIRTRRYRPAVWAVGAAAAAWLVVNLPIAIAYNTGWRGFFDFNVERSTEADTLWYIVHHLATAGLDPSYQDWKPPGLLVAIVVMLGLAAVAAVGLLARRKPRVAQLAFLAVAIFLLTTKIWSRQYSLWLLPLVALARPRWRAALLWQFSEIAVWISFLLWLMGTNNKGIDYGPLMTVVLIRDAALIALMGLVVRDILRPEHDVVRQHGLDDPGGGVFDNVRDYWADGFALRAYRERAAARAQVRYEASADARAQARADSDEDGPADASADSRADFKKPMSSD
ncbi:glycosyltransferase family 87 protein [Jatrophihabitans sp. GAS493]|uniref:glycosyltransferase family 87 protein n=1 Tax=Jatrophihabitans sp. GAS493 TaxID=1907575 RepID=UPI0012FD9C15|nr:glycosyltransferase 87 family protein [Jatrophihabitans sp. GAS493]